jgi:hypothetical protein
MEINGPYLPPTKVYMAAYWGGSAGALGYQALFRARLLASDTEGWSQSHFSFLAWYQLVL